MKGYPTQEEIEGRVLGSLLNTYSLLGGLEEPSDTHKEYMETEAHKLCQLFPQPLPDEPFSTRCGDCPDLHFEMRCSVAHRTEHLWKCGVLGEELIKNDAHGVRKHHDCPRLQFPQPLDDKELREKALLARKECEDVEHKEGEHLNWCRPILKAQRDKALALLQPKTEEAKREERERVLEIVVKELERQKTIVHTHPLYGGDYCQMCLFVKAIRQALKGGENAKS